MDDIHKALIPQDVIAAALQKVEEAQTILAPYLLQLTPEERKKRLKMGDKSLPLVEKTAEFAVTYPQFCPSYFNLDELNIDLADVINLRSLAVHVHQLGRDVEDTTMIAGSEALAQTLMYYNSVKQAAANKVSGAIAVFDELKKRFISGRSKKEDL